MKNKLHKLFRKHFPKTIEFWETCGLNKEQINAMIDDHNKRQVELLNRKLMRTHYEQKPFQVEFN